MKSYRPAAFSGLLVLVAFAVPLAAANVPTGYQEFRVVGQEAQVHEILRTTAVGEGQNSFDNTAGSFISAINSVVTLTASADSQVIIYDHWEDGYEIDVLNPVQATTLVLGDDDIANGSSCDFTTDPHVDPCGSPEQDLLFKGTELTFNSNEGLPTCGVAPCIARQPNPNPGGACQAGIPASPADRRCSVALPRNAAQIRFDGADRLVSSGGPISLVHSMDPMSPYIGGAVEIIPREAAENAVSYSIPIGRDLYGGNGSATEPLKYVYLEFVAFEDNTNISIDSPGAGVRNFVLDDGEHFSTLGYIDGTSVPALAIVINEGTKISTTAPISGLIYTAGDGNFSTRFDLLLPDVLHGTDYVTTAPGDDPAINGSMLLNLFIVNPDAFNAITVTTTDTVGTSTLNIPAGGSINYLAAAGRAVPSGSTVRLTSNRQFWGLSSYDHQGAADDWGHSWIATKFLQDNYTISYSPGVSNPAAQSLPAARLANDVDCTIPPAAQDVCNTLNRAPVWVAATQTNTRVQVDLDADGVYDQIDVNGDDVPDPANTTPTTPPPGWAVGPDATTYIVNQLRALRIYDHTDYDNTGTVIVANKPVAVSWGEDTDQATGPDPIPDTGYTVFQAFVDAVLTLQKVANPVHVPTTGGTVTYTLTLDSGDVGALTVVGATDLLPAGVDCVDFVSASSLVTFPNLSQNTADPACTNNYLGTGRDQLAWTFPPPNDELPINQRVTISYQIAIPAGPAGVLTNAAAAHGTLNGSVFRPTATADVARTDASVVKSVSIGAPGLAAPGVVLTYTLQVSNAGAAAETNVVILDAIPPDTTFVPGSITVSGPFAGSYLAGSNSVQYTAASVGAGTGPFALTFQVTINPTAAAGDVIVNQANYGSNQTPFLLSNEVETPISAAALTVVKTSTAGPLHPGQVVDWEVVVTNTGSANATNVTILDPVATNSTYAAGSMSWRRNALPFAAVTDAADADAGTLLAGPVRAQIAVGTLGPGESATLRFRAAVNAGTSGQFLPNQATVTSTEVDPTDSNLIQLPIVGTNLVQGHVFLDLDGDATQDVGEPDLPNVDVLITDPSGVVLTVTTDANGDYSLGVVDTNSTECYADTIPAVAYNGSTGALAWGATSWAEFAVAGGPADTNTGNNPLRIFTDPLGVNGNSLRIGDAPATGDRGFSRSANLSTFAGGTLRFDYRRLQGEAGDTLAVEVDYDNNGSFEATLTTIAGANDGAWQAANLNLNGALLPANPVNIRFRGVSNAAGEFFYIDNVQLCDPGAVTANVQETDPDFPSGATLTTANDPQTRDLVLGGTTTITDVGYRPQPVEIEKTSNAGGEVFPGQVVTYTVTVTNNSGVIQNNIDLTDALPAGTSYVAASGTASLLTPGHQTFRATEYVVAATGNTAITLTLAQALATDYFVMIQGSADQTTNDPSADYLALTSDPNGTGDLNVSAAGQLGFTRGTASGQWRGVVTVVECLADCAASGFRLLDVQRVAHADTVASGSDNSAVAWTAARVMLMSGHRGAGCNTATTSGSEHPTCQVRFYPTGTTTINWTRDGGGGGNINAATSTVLVLEWGTQWTVQNVNVTGSAVGGADVDATTEYNTAAISAVTRDNTWVWGRGHTSDNGASDGGDGFAITLGDGVTQLASESLVAVGINRTQSKSLQVWTMTHPDLRVDYRKEVNGDGADTTQDTTVDAATSAAMRFALVFNALNDATEDGADTDIYPQAMVAGRYTTNTNVQMSRGAGGNDFPAWIQGIDLSGSAFYAAPSSTNLTGSFGAPPNLFTAAQNIDMPVGSVLTVTYQVLVDPNLSLAITQVQNTATVDSVELVTPLSDTVTDAVVRLGVVVEYNNAAFAEANFPTPQTLVFSHDVVNTGNVADSYDVVVNSERGWQVELLDPSTGAVLAIDNTGDGTWEVGGPINTGTLAPGGRRQYDVRVTVPAGTVLGTQESTRLFAISDRNPALSDFSTDEIEVVDTTDVGPLDLTPDNSGVVNIDGSVAYTHFVINNTGGNATFDLTAVNVMNGAANPPGWSATLYGDTNFDGVYTPGVDLVIANTANLPDGGSQQFFVVVDSPPGALAGDTVVTVLTAALSTDGAIFDGGSDTTTVVLPATHDLAGGGTRLVQGGDTAIFPGTLFNQGSASDTYEVTISESAFFGLDPFLHPTHLWVDTNSDGAPDTLLASDTDGDGDWDFILGGVGGVNDPDADGIPQIVVAGGTQSAYELRRPVNVNQTTYRDIVTLSATSANTADSDSISAINLLASVTEALLTSFKAERAGDQVVLTWETGSEVGTIGFDVYRRAAGAVSWTRVGDRSLEALVYAPMGGRYRLVDPKSAKGVVTYQLVERVADSTKNLLGQPLVVDVEGLPRAADVGSMPDFEAVALTPPPGRRAGVESGAPRSATEVYSAGRIRTRSDGLIRVSAAALASALGRSGAEIATAIASGGVALARGGVPVAWMADGSDLLFVGRATDSIYTKDDVLQVTLAPGRQIEPAASAFFFADDFESGDTSAWGGDGSTPTTGTVRAMIAAELDRFPVTAWATDPDGDFWHWEYFQSGVQAVKTLVVATPAPAGVGDASLRMVFKGFSSSPASIDHQARVRVGGVDLGSTSWDGPTWHDATFALPASLIGEGTTAIEVALEVPPGVSDARFYVDRIEVEYRRRAEMVAGRLDALAPAAGHLGITGLDPGALAFDLTDPDAPRRLGVSGGGVDLVSGVSRLLVANPASAAAPTAIEPDAASNLHASANRASYLIIAGAGLEIPARQLAALRAGTGFTTKVVDIEDVYDEFAFGAVDAMAVQRLLAWTATHWTLAPTHVVLLGDGSFDYRDELGFGENLLLTPMTATPQGLVPSDQRLADVTGDGVPDLAIGRLPWRFVDQADRYLANLVARGNAGGAWRSTAIWAADDPDQGGEFPVDLGTVRGAAPAGWNGVVVDRSRLAIGPARSALAAAINDGAGFATFLGHGGLGQLASEGLLVSADVAALTNGTRRPVLTAMTCTVGRSDFPGFETLAEELLLGVDGGAIAVLSPTSLQLNEDGKQIAERFFASSREGTLGAAALSALREWVFAGGDPAVARTLALIGDPGMSFAPGGAP